MALPELRFRALLGVKPVALPAKTVVQASLAADPGKALAALGLGPDGIGIDLLASSTTIASAQTTDIGASGTLKVAIAGSATITSFGAAPHRLRFMRFTGAATLTHNGASLILPGAANIVTAPGDTAVATSDSAGNWTVRHYQRANGTPLVTTLVFAGNSGTTSIPAAATRYATIGLVNTAASLVYVPAGRKGRFRNLRIITPSAPGAGESWTFTLQKLFSDTVLTCTISGAGVNSATDLVNSVAFEANERWSLKIVSSANAPALSSVLFSLSFEAID